jgi:hypothetical protein
MGLLAAGGAAGITGAVLGWALLAGRFRKLPLQRLFGKSGAQRR